MVHSYFYIFIFLFIMPINLKNLANPTYKEEITQWHEKRIQSLQSEQGWLNLAGLFWLKEGKNTFGSDASNDIVFPAGKSPNFLGSIYLQNGEVSIEILPDKEVFSEETLILQTKIFSNSLPNPLTLKHGALRWFVIKRGDKYAIRLRDLQSPALQSFEGIKMYSIHEKWKVNARLLPPTQAKKIAITDVIGMTSMQEFAGTLVFEMQGKEFRLDAVDNGKDLFILFADKTNQNSTYGAGRFLYAEKPDNEGNVILDFNKSINPPCAFTEFATCPLPPKQNFLNIAIKAGEKKYGNH
jgi:uncharacterized protein (DUF1684 family)